MLRMSGDAIKLLNRSAHRHEALKGIGRFLPATRASSSGVSARFAKRPVARRLQPIAR
jgi:hypothetical protein